MKPKPTYKGCEQGYVCVDTQNNFIQWRTFASNRQDAWNAPCKPESRAQFKAMGFVCIYVVAQWEGR